jgi:hypothetical protein
METTRVKARPAYNATGTPAPQAPPPLTMYTSGNKPTSNFTLQPLLDRTFQSGFYAQSRRPYLTDGFIVGALDERIIATLHTSASSNQSIFARQHALVHNLLVHALLAIRFIPRQASEDARGM